jgi:DNA-binding NarL/FixJ family response regulator
MKTPPLRILLIDDHKLFAQGLQMILSRVPGLTIVGMAGDEAEALEFATARPDIIITDIHLPGTDGITLGLRLQERCPEAKLIFLSADADFALVRRALEAGGSGYLLKTSVSADVVTAIDAARKGGIFLSPEIAAALVVDYRKRITGKGGVAAKPLSAREAAVLGFVAEGLRNKEMAERLGVSVKSVETYRRRLLTKLNCSTTADLLRFAIREGLIAP